MCYCTVNNDVGTDDFSLVRGIWHVCIRAIARVSGHGLRHSGVGKSSKIYYQINAKNMILAFQIVGIGGSTQQIGA